MDIGRLKIFQNLPKEYILNILMNANIIQVSEVVLEAFKEKLEVQSLLELLKKSNLELITITRGKKGAEFYYKENGEIRTQSYSIEKPEEEVDPSGCGDAFLSITAILYRDYLCKNEKIDDDFVEKLFEYGHNLACFVVKEVGARCSNKTIENWKRKQYEEIRTKVDKSKDKKTEIEVEFEEEM